jgi:hypothetical protein
MNVLTVLPSTCVRLARSHLLELVRHIPQRTGLPAVRLLIYSNRNLRIIEMKVRESFSNVNSSEVTNDSDTCIANHMLVGG